MATYGALGTQLIQEGVLTELQVQEAADFAAAQSSNLFKALQDIRLPVEANMLQYFERKFGCRSMSVVQIADLHAQPQVTKLIPPALGQQKRLVAIALDKRTSTLSVLTDNSEDANIKPTAEMATGMNNVELVQVIPSAMEASLRRFYRGDVAAFGAIKGENASDIEWFLRSFMRHHNLTDADAIVTPTPGQGKPITNVSMPAPGMPPGGPMAGGIPLQGQYPGSFPGQFPGQYPGAYPPGMHGMPTGYPAQDPNYGGVPLPWMTPQGYAVPPGYGAPQPGMPYMQPVPQPMQPQPAQPAASPQTPAAAVHPEPGHEAPRRFTQVFELNDVAEETVFYDQSGYIDTINVLIGVHEYDQPGRRDHSTLVAQLAASIAEIIHYNDEQRRRLCLAALLHELGKTGDHVTLINIEDYPALRAMAELTYQIPAQLVGSLELPQNLIDTLNNLYEAFDGSGVPGAHSGEKIPQEARILAAVDSFVGLTSTIHANPISAEEAIARLRNSTPDLFDPYIVDALVRVVLGESATDEGANLPEDAPLVLVVADDETVGSAIKSGLVAEKIRVDWCKDPHQVFTKFDETPAQAVVIENEFNSGTGISLLKQLQVHPYWTNIPKVMVSADTRPAVAQSAFGAGATDFHSLPLTPLFAVKMRQFLALSAKSKAPPREPALSEVRAVTGVVDSPSRGVAGNLSDMALPDMLQVLSAGRKNGQLVIRRPDGTTGEIYLDQGRVVHAILGDERGEEAFYKMIGWNEGTFSLDPNFLILETAIDKSTESLIMEALRRLDEGRR